MVTKTAKISELRQIRLALGLKQSEMMELMGIDAESQNALSGYELNPKKREYPKALERAKEVYKQRMGADWRTPGTTDPGDVYNLQVALAAQAMRWNEGEEKVLKRIRAMGRRLVELERLAGVGPFPDQDDGWL